MTPERESRRLLRRSNHTLFPTARKEPWKLCGIFARERNGLTRPPVQRLRPGRAVAPGKNLDPPARALQRRNSGKFDDESRGKRPFLQPTPVAVLFVAGVAV
jgi:hypothetical protein